ncbi:MAG: hypothetical protein ACHQK9_06600, partial [Reyranellales bacterium]
MVEFEAIDKHAAAPTIGNPPPQPKDAKIDKETTKAPPPKSADPLPAPEPPKPDLAELKPVPPKPVEQPKPEPAKPVEDLVAMKPKEPEPPKVEKPPEPPKPKPAPEVKKVEPPKPAPPKPAPPKPNVDALLDDILKNKDSRSKIQTPEQQPKPVQQITRQAPAAPNLAAVVTASEVEGVRQKIRPCWNFPVGIKGQDELIVTLVVQMNQDGTPVKTELKDTGRYNNDPTFRAAADAAYRAIMNPRCQPWPLSPEKYNAWRSITFNFDPRDY